MVLPLNSIKKSMYQLGTHLKSLFQACRKHTYTWREAPKVVMPKPGNNLALPPSYRSISLLNIDYKILTSMLVARLNKILESYIHTNQTIF